MASGPAPVEKTRNETTENTVPEALSKSSSAAPIARRLRGVDLHPSVPSGLGGTPTHPKQVRDPGKTKENKQTEKHTKKKGLSKISCKKSVANPPKLQLIFSTDFLGFVIDFWV